MTHVFFDLDRTLIDHDRAERKAVTRFYREHRERFSCTAGEFLTRWREVADKYWQRYGAGEIGYWDQKRERLRELFGADRTELPDERADELLDGYLMRYTRHCELFPDARSCLETLEESVELGLLTNGGSTLQRKKLRKTGIINYFDPIVCSDEVGRAKPNPEIFRHAYQEAGRPPEECVYVGDSLELDVLPAGKLGMTGVWLNRTDDGEPVDGHPRIQSLAPFPEIVENHAKG